LTKLIGSIKSREIADEEDINEKVSKIKIEEEEIVDFKVSKINSLVYTLSKSGVVKITNYLNNEIKSVINLKNKSISQAYFNHFDLDESERNFIYTKNSKIKIYNIHLGKSSNIGTHSEKIKSLNFSSDGKFPLLKTLLNILNVIMTFGSSKS
jgi:hypothetical protein